MLIVQRKQADMDRLTTDSLKVDKRKFDFS